MRNGLLFCQHTGNVALMRIETFKSITQKCETWKEYNKRRKKIYHTDGMHYWLHF